jgi:hypothetical protein
LSGGRVKSAERGYFQAVEEVLFDVANAIFDQGSVKVIWGAMVLAASTLGGV